MSRIIEANHRAPYVMAGNTKADLIDMLRSVPDDAEIVIHDKVSDYLFSAKSMIWGTDEDGNTCAVISGP